MHSILFALALLAQDAGEAAPAAPAAKEQSLPPGAPSDDYGLVSWCYGALRGYLDLHDQAMPEVTRIETAYRRPGSKLADDLKVYADLQREGRENLKLFARAMEAAERASLRPINAIGAEAVRKGRSTWAAAPNLPKARLAQEWMSWALPARCVSTAHRLEQRAKLQGPAFQANAPADDPAPIIGTPLEARVLEDVPPDMAPSEEAPKEPAPSIDSLIRQNASSPASATANDSQEGATPAAQP